MSARAAPGGRVALRAARVFDGERFHERAAVVIEDGRVAAIVAAAEAPAEKPPDAPEALAEALLAPGFVDWQVNGGGGVLFNEDPTPEGIAAIAAAHARFGVTALLPTLVTDRPAVMDAAAAAVAAAIAAGAPGVVGAHFEGPHLGPTRAGAHDPSLIRPVAPEDRRRLARRDLGVRVATVAPETAPPAEIAALAAAGVVVALGHAEAGYDAAMTAFAAGARGVTHLFNAMSPFGHRAPGLAGAALDRPEVWCGIIADGLHVHPAALRLALAAKGDRLTLVSDAMPTVGSDACRFTLNGRTVIREGERLTLADGTLAGAHLHLAGAVRFMVGTVGAPLGAALAMASRGPARFLGLDADRGHLRPGARADIVALDAALAPIATWIGGVRADR